MEILRGNYRGKICICKEITEISYKCKFANGDIKELLKEEIIFFNNTPLNMNKYIVKALNF